MLSEKTPHIVRLKDGSIDYHHYAGLGQVARNKEMKIVASRILDAMRLPMHTFPTIVTVVLLILIF
jgi:hypothetical protein